MKKIALIIFSSLLLFTTAKAQSLTVSFHTNLICQKDSSQANWGPWGTTNARFYLYKTGSTATTVQAYFSSADNYTVATVFTVYAETKVQEDNGFAYYLYVYYPGEAGTAKSYDKTEYFKLKDQIKENQTSIQLIGYKNSTDWAWVVDGYTKY
jgi:hypothetical protein